MMKTSFAVSAAVVLLSGQAQALFLFRDFECNTTPAAANDSAEFTYGPTCTDIASQFPDAGVARPRGDERIMCPFLRLLHRSGAVPGAETGDVFNATVASVTGSAAAFGCAPSACGPVAGAVSALQQRKNPATLDPLADSVDFFRLFDAPGVSHDCGFLFSLGAREVEDLTKFMTLLRLFSLRDREGRLSFGDLMQAKRDACKRDYEIARAFNRTTINAVDEENETLVVGGIDFLETKLIYGFLGGVDNGYVDFSDVYRFFNGRLPERKSKFVFDDALSAHIDGVAAGGV